jgi:hypothetical protein
MHCVNAVCSVVTLAYRAASVLLEFVLMNGWNDFVGMQLSMHDQQYFPCVCYFGLQIVVSILVPIFFVG